MKFPKIKTKIKKKGESCGCGSKKDKK